MANTECSDFWRRPEDAGPYPREWDRFKGVRPMADGRVPHFWIRDLTEDEMEEAVSFLKKHLLTEEQMATAAGIVDDPQAISEMENFWREGIKQRISLGAYTDWPDGRERLAGLNVLGVSRKDDPPIAMTGSATKALVDLYGQMLSAADVFARYGVSSYVSGMGLSVSQEFRGQGLGLRLLRVREPLCVALRLPLTVTLFSGAQSQKLAERAGFEVLETLVYADFALEDGIRPFASTTWPCAKLKAKLYGGKKNGKL